VAVSDEAGRFSAGTREPGDGVPAGSYAVTVVWCPGEEDEPPNLLPPRYADPERSGLRIEVSSTGLRDVELELTDHPSRSQNR
jgi:hypothetical protein